MEYVKEHSIIEFPEPQGLQINMMPFRFRDTDSLPEDVRQYVDIVNECEFEDGSVCYLSIDESWVGEGRSQRRPGAHIERPCMYKSSEFRQEPAPNGINWGGGAWGGYGPGFGIYMGSNVADSCGFWDCETMNAQPALEGNIECIRSILEGEAEHTMKANVLYWMSDLVPHESLPVSSDVYRQWIRIVSPKVDVWFADHSTRNPAVESEAYILYGNKFEPEMFDKMMEAYETGLAWKGW